MRSAREPDPRSVRAGTKTGYAGDADAATWRKTGKLKRDAAADYRSAGRQTGPEAPQASSVDIVIDAKVREPRADLAQALELALEVDRSEEHTSELQSLMSISYADFCLKTKYSRAQTTKTTN